MPGGPINGVPWSAMTGLAPGGAAITSAARRGAEPDNPVNYTGIIIPTVLQMSAEAVSFWTSLTCFYDRYWVPDTAKVTLPICMFHVTDITPVYSVEVSKKRVLVYEQKESPGDLAQNMRNTSMRAIIDNSVKQPTTYNMEAIVPFQPAGRYISDGAKIISDMIAGFSDLLGGTKFTDVWEGAFSSASAYSKTARAAVELAGKLPEMDGVSYINMNSLEAMAESCRTLCMKMWTGYDYKYVQITGMTSKKKGTEDDVFRVSLTLQETPVLTLSPPRSSNPNVGSRSQIVSAISAAQEARISPLIALTGTKQMAEKGKIFRG